MEGKCRFLFWWILAIFVYSVQGNLDINEFIGDEPLTTRRIVEDLLAYFQHEDPHGIPVLTIPDPINLEDEYQVGDITLENVTVSGHSQLRLEHVGVNLEELTAQIRIEIPHLEVLSYYDWPGWFSSSSGDMNLTLTYLEVGLIAELGVSDEGSIRIEDLKLQIFKDQFLPELTGLLTQHQVAVAVADTFFDTVIIPLIQSSVSSTAVTALNKRLKESLQNRQFPVDISPVDFMIAKLRNDFMQKKNLDPFVVEQKELDLPLPVSLVIKKATVEGLSTLHRDKEISVELIDNRIYARVSLSTQTLKMYGDWSLYSSLVPLGSGHADLSVDGMNVAIHIQQDADVRHPPILRDIDIELGNVALLSSGERNLDYLLEGAINIFPNIFKNIILDRKVEGILKQRIQENFNVLDLEKMIYERLEKL